MSYDSWLYGGVARRDFRNSAHLKDWEPTRYRSKTKRIKGKRVCGKNKSSPCNFNDKALVWSFTRNNKRYNYYVKACSRCGRHGYDREVVEILPQ